MSSETLGPFLDGPLTEEPPSFVDQIVQETILVMTAAQDELLTASRHKGIKTLTREADLVPSQADQFPLHIAAVMGNSEQDIIDLSSHPHPIRIYLGVPQACSIIATLPPTENGLFRMQVDLSLPPQYVDEQEYAREIIDALEIMMSALEQVAQLYAFEIIRDVSFTDVPGYPEKLFFEIQDGVLMIQPDAEELILQNNTRINIMQ